MSDLSFEEDLRSQQFGIPNRGRSFSEDSLSSSEDGLSDYVGRRPMQVEPRNRAGSFTSSVEDPLSVYRYDGKESEFDRGSSYVGPRPQRPPTVYRAPDSEQPSDRSSSQFDDAESMQGMPEPGPMGEIGPAQLDDAPREEAPIEAEGEEQAPAEEEQRGVEGEQPGQPKFAPLPASMQARIDANRALQGQPLIEEEPPQAVEQPAQDVAGEPIAQQEQAPRGLILENDEAGSDAAHQAGPQLRNRFRPARSPIWMKMLEDSINERKAKAARKQMLAERKQEYAAAKKAKSAELWKSSKMNWLKFWLGGQISFKRKFMRGWLPQSERPREGEGAAADPAAGLAPRAMSRRERALEIGGDGGTRFRRNAVVQGMYSFGGLVANRNARPEDDPSGSSIGAGQIAYDAYKAKKDAEWMQYNMTKVPMDYYTSATNAANGIMPKPKSMGLQNLPPPEVLLTKQPRVGLLMMNAAMLANSASGDAATVGQTDRMKMAHHLDRFRNARGLRKGAEAVRAVAANQRLLKARRAQGLAPMTAAPFEVSAAMNSKKAVWDPDVPVVPDSNPEHPHETGPLQMQPIAQGEEPKSSAFGQIARGAEKVGGAFGHVGRVVSNTDKGFEEMQAGRPGLGLAKSIGATGVFLTRKAVTAPLKGLPVPGADVVGGELGKVPFTAAGLAIEGVGKGLRMPFEKAARNQRRAEAFATYARQSAADEEPGLLPRGVEDEKGLIREDDVNAAQRGVAYASGSAQDREDAWEALSDRALAQGVDFGPQFSKEGVRKASSAWLNYKQGDVRDPEDRPPVEPYTTQPRSIKADMSVHDKRSANAAGLPLQRIGWGEYMKARYADRHKKALDDLKEYATLPIGQYQAAGGVVRKAATAAGSDSAWTGLRMVQPRRDPGLVPDTPAGWADMTQEEREEQIGPEKLAEYRRQYDAARLEGHRKKLIWDDDAAKASVDPPLWRKLILGDHQKRRPPRSVNFQGRPPMLKADDERLKYMGQPQVDALSKSFDDYAATQAFPSKEVPKPQPDPDQTLDEARAKSAKMLGDSAMARLDANRFAARAILDKQTKDQIKHWTGVYKKLPAVNAERPGVGQFGQLASIPEEEEMAPVDDQLPMINQQQPQPRADQEDDEGYSVMERVDRRPLNYRGY